MVVSKELYIKKIKEEIEKAINICKENNFRFAIFLFGISRFHTILDILKDLLKNNELEKGVILCDNPNKDLIKYIVKKFKNIAKLDIITYKNSQVLLGTTQDFAFIDITDNYTPDDLGRIVNTVRGGGFLLFIAPNFEKFKENIVRFHYEVITPPYTIKDVRHIFSKWFLDKVLKNDGIICIDGDTLEILKEFSLKVKRKKKYSLKIPNKPIFNKELYKIAKTQDQINVIQLLEKFLEKGRKSLLLIADRGRGKSASIGLGIAGMLEKKERIKVIVTSRERENVEVLYKFIIKGLKALDIKFKAAQNYIRIDNKRKVIFLKPIDSLREKADLLVVDEAASIYINILKKYIKKFDKTIFSSTIHGYEGTGRTFSVRFMKILENGYKSNLLRYEMKEPIRYGENDPVERWLFNTLILDAEPVDLNDNDLKDIENKNVVLQKLDPKELFLGNKENILRQFVGIYILAHYRNRPNDILLLADAPHHEAWALMLKNSKKIVNAIQLAREGGLSDKTIKKMLEGYEPRGNIIPDVLTKHFRDDEFAKLKGGRIVRIATHPSVMGRGLGSVALQLLEKRLKERNLDWVGASFGATYELLKFWIKNDFLPVHISPGRNPSTGEYSTIVLYPLSKKAYEYVKGFRLIFKIKFLDLLHYLYRDIEPNLARLFLISKRYEENKEISIDNVDLKRIYAFCRGKMTFEPTYDALLRMTKRYFLLSESVRLNIGLLPEEEELLIAAILQARSIKKVCELFFLDQKEVLKRLRRIFRKLLSFVEGSIE